MDRTISADERLSNQRICARMRARRKDMEISQVMLADYLGLSYQQVQKYEAGACMITAARLERVCSLLGTPISYYFTNTPLELALPPQEWSLLHIFRNLEETHRQMLHEMAQAFAVREALPD